MAKIQRISHDHQTPFWLVVVLVFVGISSGDTRRKQATTWPIYLGPPIFFTDSVRPIKCLVGGLIIGAPGNKVEKQKRRKVKK